MATIHRERGAPRPINFFFFFFEACGPQTRRGVLAFYVDAGKTFEDAGFGGRHKGPGQSAGILSS